MRRLFFIGVLIGYVAAIPGGRPKDSPFDLDRVSILDRAREFQRAYRNNRFPELLDFAEPDKRLKMTRDLIKLAEGNHLGWPEEADFSFSPQEGVDAERFRRRFEAIAASPEGKELELSALFADELRWLRTRNRMWPSLVLLFEGQPMIQPLSPEAGFAL